MATKRCSKCRQWKPTSAFWQDLRKPDGLRSQCGTCAYASRREWRRRNRDKVNAINLKSYHKHKVARGNAEMLRRYRFTRADYDHLLVDQNGCCAICRATSPGDTRSRFAIDHDHQTGQVRGLLCNACNLGLGKFKDRLDLLRAATAYLEAHDAAQGSSTEAGSATTVTSATRA
jgi:hypothetical protein